MSLDMVSEPVCYVHCNFCNTILAVSVPSSSLFNIVTVRCGHCGNLLSVNMGASSQTLPLQDPQKLVLNSEDLNKDFGSSSKCNKVNASESTERHEPPRMPPIRLGTFSSHSLWTEAGQQQAREIRPPVNRRRWRSKT